MNATELQALRRLLFYSTIEAASMIGGVSERAWKYWEAGARAVPPDVAGAILEILEWRENLIDLFMERIASADREWAERGAHEDAIDSARLGIVFYERAIDQPDSDRLWRPYQSACAAILAMDDRVTLVPFDGPAYAAWLGTRADSDTMRGAWAAEISQSI